MVSVMGTCEECGTRITSLRDGWVHLATGVEGHEPWPVGVERPDATDLPVHEGWVQEEMRWSR